MARPQSWKSPKGTTGKEGKTPIPQGPRETSYSRDWNAMRGEAELWKHFTVSQKYFFTVQMSMAQRCLFFGDSSGQGRSELSLTAAPQLQEKIVLTSPSVFCACVVESDWWWSGRDAVSSCEPTAKDALDWCHLNFSKGTNKSCCCPAWMPGGKLSDSLLVFSRAW